MPPCLDFASVPILTPVTRVLKIINNTAIGTHFKVEIMNFKGENNIITFHIRVIPLLLYLLVSPVNPSHP